MLMLPKLVNRLAILYCGLAFALTAADADVRTVTILHTNDLHARFLPNEAKLGGFAHIATLLRDQRQGCTNCLTLDAGDLVQGTPVSTIFKGVPCYEVANSFGIDVSTLGNHEWDYGYANLANFIKTARHPIVTANVVDAQGRLVTPRPWVVKKVNGLRVGIIGVLMNDLLEKYTTPKLIGPYHTIPAVDAIRQHLKKLRKKSDLIVVLAHTEPAEAEQILRDIPEVSVVVNGHAHSGMPEMARAGQGVVVRARGYGVEVGRLELAYDKRERRLTQTKWTKLTVDSKVIPPAADTAQAVAGWEAKVAEAVDAVIGESKHDFTKEQMRDLIERIMRERLGVDLAYMNLGGVRDLFKTGTLRKRHVWNVMPFDNAIVTGKFKGSQLPETILKRNQIDPNREYTLAINDFTAATEAVNWKLTFGQPGPMIRDVIIEWIEKVKVVE